MRLLINGGDWNTVGYVSDLKRNKYTDWYFRGYKEHPSKDGTSMIFDYELAALKSGLAGKRKISQSKGGKKRQKK